jgi:hypothetical protein
MGPVVFTTVWVTLTLESWLEAEMLATEGTHAVPFKVVQLALPEMFELPELFIPLPHPAMCTQKTETK